MDRKYLEKAMKPKRGLGQAATRHRRKLITSIDKERESRVSERRNQALNEVREASRFAENEAVRERLKWVNALLSTITAQQTAVLRSRGRTNKVGYVTDVRSMWYATNSHVTYDPDTPVVTQAYTDFDTVNASFNVRAIPDMYKTDELLNTIAAIRGVYQHEFGHLLHTTPFPVLIENYETNDSKTGMEYLHKVAHEMSLGNYKTFQYAWNVLEDQRMESLAVMDVPRLKLYFTSMVLSVIVKEDTLDNAWLLCAGRTYLPKDIRYYAKKEFRPHEPGLADEWLNIVNKYKSATTANEMLDTVIEAMKFMSDESISTDIPQTFHPNPAQRGDGYQMDKEMVKGQGESLGGQSDPMEGYAPSEKQDNGDEQGSPSDKSSEQGSGKPGGSTGDGSAEGGDDTETSSKSSSSGRPDRVSLPSVESNVTDTPTRGFNRNAGDGTLKHAMEQRLDEVMSEISTDVENNIVLQNATVSASSRSIPVLDDEDLPPLFDHHIQTANQMCGNIQDALADYVTASDPHWVDRLEHGVINPLVFRTKEVGSLDYRRDRVGEMVDGLNIHVSFLSDVSMSMEGPPMTALSVAMYAMGEACVRLGVGATYTVWSSTNETYRIWEDGVPKPQLMGAMGGTDPTDALDDLVNHNPEDAKHHLVFIFTDGDWGRFRPLSDWSIPGRRIIVVRYNQWAYSQSDNYDPYGGDGLINITKVEDMPSALHRVMSEMLASNPTHQ